MEINSEEPQVELEYVNYSPELIVQVRKCVHTLPTASIAAVVIESSFLGGRWWFVAEPLAMVR